MDTRSIHLEWTTNEVLSSYNIPFSLCKWQAQCILNGWAFGLAPLLIPVHPQLEMPFDLKLSDLLRAMIYFLFLFYFDYFDLSVEALHVVLRILRSVSRCLAWSPPG